MFASSATLLRFRSFFQIAFLVAASICASVGVSASTAFAQDDDLFGDLGADSGASASADFGGGAAEAGAASADSGSTATDAAGETGSDAGATGATSADSEKRENYLVWMFRSLGWFFTIVFSLLSLTMVALVVMNIVALRRNVVVPDELTTQFGELLDENKFQEAYQLAKDDESLLGKVLATGLSRMPTGFEKATQAMRDVEQEETMRLEHQLGYLALIGNLAPMVGLFGTVVGMIASFQAIASGGAAPSPQKLAEGIATALFTTEIGLAIALPALAAFDILKNRLARFILDVSIVSDNFMGRFANVGAPKK